MAQKFTVPITVKQLTSPGSDAVTVYVDADTYARLKVEAGGRLVWGSGSGAGDVNLYRDEADVLRTDDTFKTPTLFVDNIEIDPTGAVANQVLKFDGSKFVSASAPAGATNLDGLTDVTVPSPVTNDVLQYNGTAWVNVSASAVGATNLDGLSDVVITSPEEFQGLSYNGTSWVNSHIPLVSYVRNAETTTLTTGTAVYLFGATGDHATVKRADNASDATSSKTIGLVGANIAASQNGPIVTRGYVDGIDLSVGYSPGDILWLGTNGAFTKTKPTAPNHLVFIGVVVRATNNGIVYVATQNGYELDELHNVQINGSLASGDFLKYNGSLWVNDPINLGTDTIGSYVQSLVAGTGVTLSNNSGEGATPTVAIGQNVATSASVTFAHLIVQGDMEVQGTITRLNETNLDVDEAFIYLNATSASANPDMGIAFNYNDGTYKHAGFFRDSSDGIFKVFEGYTPEPVSPINTSDPTYDDAPLQAEKFISTIPTGVAPMLVSSSTVVTNFNADKLDGYDSTYFAPINSPTFTGTVTLPNNTVALGTQTTGNYVADVSSGTGITVTHTPGEGTTPSVAINTATVPLLASANTFSTNQIIEGSSTSALLRITQTGTGNALLIEDETNPDLTPLVITATGEFVHGHTAVEGEWYISSGNSHTFHIVDNDSTNTVGGNAWIGRYNGAAGFTIARSNGTNIGDRGTLVAGDIIGGITWAADDGISASYNRAGQISVVAEGTLSTGVTPTRMVFSTGNTTGLDTERMRIDSVGNVGIGISSPDYRLHVYGGTASAEDFAMAVDVAGGNVGDSAGYVMRAADANELGAIRSFVENSYLSNMRFYTAGATNTLSERMRIDSAGAVSIGSTQAATSLNLTKNISGSTNSQALRIASPVATGVTGEARYISIVPSVDASVAIGNLVGTKVYGATLGASASILTQYGFWAASDITAATTNYGFYGDIASGTGRWNLYMNGTAANYLAGRLGIGANLTSGAMAQITNTTASDTALLVRGAASQSGALLEAQNSAGTSLSVITSGGEYVSNHTASISPVAGVGARIQTHSTSSLNTSISVMRWANDNAQTFYTMSKSRGTTVGSHVAVTSGDYMGTIIATGSDGASFIESARVQFAVDGVVSTSVVPGRIEFATNNSAGTRVERMRIDSAGRVGIGATPVNAQTLVIGKNLTGAAAGNSVYVSNVIQSDVTTAARSFWSYPGTAAASFTINEMFHFNAQGLQSSEMGAGSAITSQYAFYAHSSNTGATNNFGFYGNITSATGRWNLYMAGTAANYMAGRLGVGATLTSGAMAQVVNTTAADKAFVVKGAASQSGYLTEWQDSSATSLAYVDSSGNAKFVSIDGGSA